MCKSITKILPWGFIFICRFWLWETHLFLFLFVNKQSKVWTLQVVGKWSQRQETRLQRESGMGLLSHWTSEHQGASMTVREVSKRKAGLWTFQSLNVQRPRDSSIKRGPAYKRKIPRFLALCSSLTKEALTGCECVWTQVWLQGYSLHVV